MTRQKKLKAETIIPSTLYVERQADRQLHAVIEDMGRPAYVLVARQMGKTNLLLHARTVLESEQDVFAYIDFSLPAESLRDQLRGIVDEVIRMRAKKLGAIAPSIQEARKNASLPAHKEHENELRTLLESSPGKIVLIFDEIDALTNTSYSDQLFSLVRSVYFSRANFPEFGRLTYVLSGVAEPSELIKNKNTSPFNIGEKIYLDEFTRLEIDSFLQKAELDLPEHVADELYSWTQGNPRITWDVCSALEDELLSGRTIARSTIAEVIQRLYFGSVARAPIDHIRTIVADQRDLREAIRRIRAEDGNIGDALRTKLYLAGVISSGFDATKPALKNKVVDLALSSEWLDDVDRRKYDALELARERVKNKQHKEAIGLFLEHLSAIPEREDNKKYIYLEIARSFYEDGKFEEAKTWFQKHPITAEESLVLHLQGSYFVALCDTHLEHYAEAIGIFQRVIDAQREDAFYFESLLNQAAARILAGGENNLGTAESAIRLVLASQERLRAQMPEDEGRKLLIGGRVNLAGILEKTNRLTDAIEQFEVALDECMTHEKATILTSLVSLEADRARKLERTKQAREFIAAYKPTLVKRSLSNRLAFDYASLVQLYSLIAETEESGEKKAFGKFLRQQYLNDTSLDTQFTFDVSVRLWNQGHTEIARAELTEFLSRVRDNAPAEARAAALRLILFRNRRPEAVALRRTYFQLLEKKPYTELTGYDFSNAVEYIGELYRQRKYEEALRIVDIVNMYEAATPDDLRANHIVVDYFHMILSVQTGATQKMHELAKRLTSADIDAYVKAGRLSADDARLIKSQAADLLSVEAKLPAAKPQPAKNPFQDIGKNELITVKYTDGRVVTNKFKKLKADLDNRQCVLIHRGVQAVS